MHYSTIAIGVALAAHLPHAAAQMERDHAVKKAIHKIRRNRRAHDKKRALKQKKAETNEKDQLIAQDEPSEDYTYSYDYDDDLTWDDDFWFVSFLRLLNSFDMYYHALTKSISYL